MPSKQKTAKTGMDKLVTDQRKERKMIADMAKRERIMKWILIGVAIVLLLLILFVGYATDWLKGVSKDDTVGTTGITAATDASTTGEEATGATGTSSTGRTSTGSTSNTGTSSNTGSTSTNTSKESSTTNTTTNNTTTTDNGGDDTSDSSLLSLYGDASVGDAVSDILGIASGLGINAECHNDLLLQVCSFKDGDLEVTTKNLLGTGIITSVTKNF